MPPRVRKVFPALSEFPTNEKACRRFNNLCQYAPFCTTASGSWGQFIDDYVIAHRDDPPSDPTDHDDHSCAEVTDRTDVTLDLKSLLGISSVDRQLEKIQ